MSKTRSVLKKQLRLQRQLELLKNFQGDYYQEKKVGDEWHVKSWNRGTKRWQVAIYKEDKFKKYKAFGDFLKEEKELDDKFKQAIAFERPSLESVSKMLST